MTPEEAKNRSRGYSTDMSPEAVKRRIDIVSRLREMTRILGKAEILGPVEQPPSPAAEKAPELPQD